MIPDLRDDAFPKGVQLAFYGDDFTGATDAMEATALAGLPTILFTRTPDEALLARFADRAVVGIAGTARAHGPEWMEENLPAAFKALSATGAPVIQYKVCSTFDSAPHVGSIGRALDIGARETGAGCIPIVVGAPHLGRWVVFGNLFAAAGGEAYRIDRHPTMSRHPVTPMDESDLAIHLASQTDRLIDRLDVSLMAIGAGDAAMKNAQAKQAALLIDTFDENTQAEAGRLVWEGREAGVFAIGSSGLQHALIAYWRRAGIAPQAPETTFPFDWVNRLLVLSGSCSPVTAGQIATAEAAGFAVLPLDVMAATLDKAGPSREAVRIFPEIEAAFAKASGVIVCAARAVEDRAYTDLFDKCGGKGSAFETAQHLIGETLGEIAHLAVPKLNLTRLVVAGGDTSGRVVGRLPIAALEVAAPFAPGAPLCRVHEEEGEVEIQGLELVLKGGQIGEETLFIRAMGTKA